MGSNRASGDFAAHQLAKREIARERERDRVWAESISSERARRAAARAATADLVGVD